jgi:small nuclear ribonucleoprotein B and B'
MNLVLADTEEFRRIRRRGKAAPGAPSALTETEERRAIGLTIIRGAQVVSVSVDGPPPTDPAARMGGGGSGQTTAAALAAGTGMSRPTGRGMPSGLTGPVPGAAGPGGFGGFPPGFVPPGGPPGFPGAPPFGRGGPPGGPRE